MKDVEKLNPPALALETSKAIAQPFNLVGRIALIILLLSVSASTRIGLQHPTETSHVHIMDRVYFEPLPAAASGGLLAMVLVLGLGLEGPVLRALSKKYLGMDIQIKPPQL